MKIRTSEAARRLGTHPSHLFLNVVALAPELTFSDVWPEIDEDLFQTVSALVHRGTSGPTERAKPNDLGHSIGREVSDAAIRVLDKLSRQGKWGAVSVTIEALSNLAHVPERELEEVVAELRKGDFLEQDGTGLGKISLDPAKGQEIERIVRQTSEGHE